MKINVFLNAFSGAGEGGFGRPHFVSLDLGSTDYRHENKKYGFSSEDDIDLNRLGEKENASFNF